MNPGWSRAQVVWLARFAFLLGLGTPASAQTIAGRVVEAQSSRPVSGALVTLIRAENEVARTLSTEDGTYRFSTLPGSYRIGVRRIGYADWSSDLVELVADGRVSLELRVPYEPVRLPDLVATTTNRCVDKPSDVPELSTLWAEVRKALESLEQLDTGNTRSFQIARGTQLLDNPSLVAIDSSKYSSLYSDVIGAPFAAPSPSALAGAGYVVETESGYVYFGLDAATLLSSEFAETHCFRFELPPEALPQHWLGLVFEPVRDDGRADVAGVLWLDAETADLRRLQFQHVAAPGRLGDRPLGGEVDFERLSDGLLVVRSWSIRSPDIHPRAVAIAGFANRAIQEDEFDIREDWGILAGLLPGPGAASQATAVSGRVTQIFRGHMLPVGGVRVSARGSPFTTLSNRDGTFSMALPGPGPWNLELSPQAPRSLFDQPSSVLSVSCDSAICDVQLPTPSNGRFLHSACEPDGGDTLPLMGVVTSDSGAVVPNAHVLVSKPVATQTRTDNAGGFVLCLGKPGAISFQVAAPGFEVVSKTVEWDPAHPVRQVTTTMSPCEPREPRYDRQVTCLPAN